MNAAPLALAALIAAGAAPLGAQDSLAFAPSTHHGWTRAGVRYGRWVSAAAALGFTLLAAHEYDTANRSWQHLLDLCRSDNSACQLTADGRYAAQDAERLYQETVAHDRRARRRLIIGQVSLLTSAALFILDLHHHNDGPPNIPFHGLELTAEPVGEGARLGVRLTF